MSKYISQEMAKAPGAGLLSVPVTHFKRSDHAFDAVGDGSNLPWSSAGPASRLFAGGDNVELIRLTLTRVNHWVKAAAKHADASTAIVARVGRGSAITIDTAQTAAHGAVGVLRPDRAHDLSVEGRPAALDDGSVPGIWRRSSDTLGKD